MESLSQTAAVHPVAALIDQPQGVLAVITGVEGPSYRPLGAMMAIMGPGRFAGSLSSGCVEGDIAHHAEAARKDGKPTQLRYGLGSAFRDIQLPCGGGLDILLVPRPDRQALRELVARHAARLACTLVIDSVSGALTVQDDGETGWQGRAFHTRIEPEIAFHVYGKGPEASTFAALSHSAGYPTTLLSPDDETLAAADCRTRHLVSRGIPEDIRADDRTAVVLFFHDHDWEPPILKAALASGAFYIGAQGSLRARAMRDAELQALGVAPGAIARIKGPIGLVRSARDARTLAVSVLAEVLAERR